MEVRYQRELNENYLVLEDTCPGDEYAVRMLAENEIPGFLKMKRKQMDRTWSFYYEISGRQSVREFWNGARSLPKSCAACSVESMPRCRHWRNIFCFRTVFAWSRNLSM